MSEKNQKIKKVVNSPGSFSYSFYFWKKKFFHQQWTPISKQFSLFFAFLEISAMGALSEARVRPVTVSQNNLFFIFNSYLIGVLKSKKRIWKK